MRAKTAAIVVTACSKGKSVEPDPALRAAALQSGDVASVARRWAQLVASADNRLPARALYQGRAFREAELAARPLAADIYVISAGLGIVSADCAIPSYSLTVVAGADNILARLEPAPSCPSAWWRELRRETGTLSFGDLFGSSSGPILLAGGSSYLSMIAHEFDELGAGELARLRLFTAASRPAIPRLLEPFTMPYDRRLEGLPGRSGTLSDFAQRALRHFAEVIIPDHPEGSAGDHAAAVDVVLAQAEAPVRRRGTSMSDEAIVALIRTNWHRADGKSAAMLRLLRDSFQVACEQARFKKLFAEARAGLAS